MYLNRQPLVASRHSPAAQSAAAQAARPLCLLRLLGRAGVRIRAERAICGVAAPEAAALATLAPSKQRLQVLLIQLFEPVVEAGLRLQLDAVRRAAAVAAGCHCVAAVEQGRQGTGGTGWVVWENKLEWVARP